MVKLFLFITIICIALLITGFILSLLLPFFTIIGGIFMAISTAVREIKSSREAQKSYSPLPPVRIDIKH